MRQYSRGIISYLIFVAVLVGVILLITSVSRKNMEEDYTRAEFVADMEGGKVSSIEIHLNGETPTGSLEIHLKNGSQKKLYVADVTEAEALVRSYGFDPRVFDVEREGWVLTTLVPMLIVLAVGILDRKSVV